jgi:methyltransferase (TIGR00027 family)
MNPGQPSKTAYRVALRRAAHQILDRPLVLDDPIALRIVGPRAAEEIQSNRGRYDSGFGRALRLFLVARSRCAEEALAEAFAAGVRQYVVLGAGLDTFAYRNPYPAGRLHVFEVDVPATQAWKRDLLRRTHIAEPDTLTFVPVDFETQKLADRLRDAGFRDAEPAFFSWLGVTMYLTRDAILSTFAYVAERAPGSGITFDYMIPPSHLSLPRRFVFHWMARRLARVGEPWTTSFEPEALKLDLCLLGFLRVEDMDSAALNARFFGGREKRLGGVSASRVVTAFR